MPITEALVWDIVRWAVCIALGIFLAVLIYRVLKLFLGEMNGSNTNRDPGAWMETNWGGLGGGLSGWRVSNAIIYLFLISFLLGCLILVVVSVPPPKNGDDEKNKDNQKKETQGQKSGDGKEGEQKDRIKQDQKPEAGKDGAQQKETEKIKDDKCAETARKSPRSGPKATPRASGCTVDNKDVKPPSPTPTAVKKPGQ